MSSLQQLERTDDRVRAHQRGMLQLPAQENVDQVAARHGDADAVTVGVRGVEERRGSQDQVGQVDLHVGRRKIHKGCSVRVDAKRDGDVPLPGLQAVDDRARSRVDDRLELDADCRGKRMTKIEGYPCHLTSDGVLCDRYRREADSGSQPAGLQNIRDPIVSSHGQVLG